MGHERVGALPKSQEWRQLVGQLGLSAHSGELVQAVADNTLEQVRGRFARIQDDPGVQAAFGFLIGLATSDIPPLDAKAKANPPVDLTTKPSVLRLVSELDAWIRQHGGSPEYAELAKRAGADAIAAWTKAKARQGDLFNPETDAAAVWRSAGTGAGFCEVSRVFFGKFVERYLKFFLEREASAELSTLQAREEFSRRLTAQMDEVSRHAFETAKITQSFAAGWFNKHLGEGRRPNDEEIQGFLSYAFGKVREELRREETPT